MNLFLHKLTVSQMEASTTVTTLPDADYYRENLPAVVSSTELSDSQKIGSLTTMVADLVESLSRTDPAYELARLQRGSDAQTQVQPAATIVSGDPSAAAAAQ